MSAEAPDAGFEQLLAFIRDQRGFDFTGYKRQSLRRRTDKRMAAIGADSYEAYREHLEVTPEEFPQLFDTILINVTRFFRDPEAWRLLQEEILPAQLRAVGEHDGLRGWTAGCASGEEAYTVAMVLAELMGIDQVRDRVKIYATDVDEDALETARKATYDAHAIEAIPARLQARYLVSSGDRAAIHPDLRRAVIFGRHDLLNDAPIGRIDLLTCRNTLMYFNAETQARVVDRLHFALKDSGILLLGRVETLLGHTALFEPIDLSRRAFRKAGGHDMRQRLRDIIHPDVRGQEAAPTAVAQQLQAVFDAGSEAQVLIDDAGTVVTTNRQARALFGLAISDHGRPFHDLEVSYHPIELRSWIRRALAEGRTLAIEDVAWQRHGRPDMHLAVDITPLEEAGTPAGVVITVHDRSALWQLEQELKTANHELASAYEELQSTNEELETTNEELQSTNEELETTNEELQSTNEELETMNVELQATNEELHAINDQMRLRSEDLDEVNAFLESILGNLEGGVVVLDRDLVVTVWNDGVVDLWGMREHEAIGRRFLDLDIGLPVTDLSESLDDVLTGRRPRVRTYLKGRDRLGRDVTVDVTCGPLLDHQRGTRGVIVHMADAEEGTR